MCNDYEQHIAYAEYAAVMQQLALDLPLEPETPDLPQADDIRIGQTGPVIRAAGNAVELAPMTFGFPPPRPKAAPVFNFRSEGRHFQNSHRCVVLASAFFEFTGARYPKTKHRFTLNGAPFMGIAGLWKPGDDEHPDSFTMLTVPPGPDVAPVHDRQVAVLPPAQWSHWLYLDQPEPDLLKPLPQGTLSVAVVRQGAA
jgi:putative SOS response-associated peptidase YedK